MSRWALAAWLRAAHDDGEPPLRVTVPDIGRPVVTRADGSSLSETEAREVRGILAADAAERLTVEP